MITITRKRFLLIAWAAFVGSFAVSVAVFSARNQEPKTQNGREWLTVTPAVASKVKDLEIVNMRINRPDTQAPGVAFEIRNNSNKSVMAYEVACGDSAISQDGYENEENPIVLITPHGTYTVEMNDELTQGKPIVITAAVFNDKKEEGEESALKRMHGIRTHQRALLKAKKEKALERSPNQ
jgi:hypothetical protein